MQVAEQLALRIPAIMIGHDTSSFVVFWPDTKKPRRIAEALMYSGREVGWPNDRNQHNKQWRSELHYHDACCWFPFDQSRLRGRRDLRREHIDGDHPGSQQEPHYHLGILFTESFIVWTGRRLHGPSNRFWFLGSHWHSHVQGRINDRWYGNSFQRIGYFQQIQSCCRNPFHHRNLWWGRLKRDKHIFRDLSNGQSGLNDYHPQIVGQRYQGWADPK